MKAKKVYGFRLSDSYRSRLEEMTFEKDETMTSLLEQAIDLLWAHRKGIVQAPEKQPEPVLNIRKALAIRPEVVENKKSKLELLRRRFKLHKSK